MNLKCLLFGHEWKAFVRPSYVSLRCNQCHKNAKAEFDGRQAYVRDPLEPGRLVGVVTGTRNLK